MESGPLASAPAGPAGAVRDRTCLIALRHPDHACRHERGGLLEDEGDRCAIWARVQAARSHHAGRPVERERHQAAARESALAVLSATRRLLDAASTWTGVDDRLAGAWSEAAATLLLADQAAALAGWSRCDR